jgi:hypothetical protein
MIGGSTLGYSLIPRKKKPIIPKIRIVRESTIASTGLWMLMLDKLAICF